MRFPGSESRPWFIWPKMLAKARSHATAPRFPKDLSFFEVADEAVSGFKCWDDTVYWGAVRVLILIGTLFLRC
jgi:hypothetical protein